MASTRLIRRRIKGVQNIAKITRAMEMIATSKMKRAQDRGLAGRPYAEKIEQVVADLAALVAVGGGIANPLLVQRPVKKAAIIHITPDRGLTGGLVSNMNRKIGGFILEQQGPVSVITVGRKGTDFIRRYGREMRAEFSHLGDYPSLLDITPIAKIVLDDYTNGIVDTVYIAYSRFVTTMTQTPAIQQLIPVRPAQIPRAENVDYIFEPNPAEVLNQLLPRYVEMEIYHAVLEAIASEQSARMVAMKNATDNAGELIKELTLTYNKARQETITKELLDIAGGAAALT